MKPDHQPAWAATWAGLAEELTADKAARLRRERMDRARYALEEPPPARTHSERMDAARGVHLYGDGLRTPRSDRRRIRKHREADNV